MPRPNISCIDFIIIKIFLFQHPIFIADQTVFFYSRWIKLDLNLDILRYCRKCG